MRSWKGHSYLFQAVALFTHRELHLRLLAIDEGWQRANLKAFRAKLVVDERADFAARRDFFEF